MRLVVNGEDRSFEDVATVTDLVAALGLGSRRVAVERNREVVPASAWSATRLAEGDVLEIVHFVGGG